MYSDGSILEVVPGLASFSGRRLGAKTARIATLLRLRPLNPKPYALNFKPRRVFLLSLVARLESFSRIVPCSVSERSARPVAKKRP